MKSSSKLIRAASRLWPNNHERYKEMCALAATGQLGGPQMSELNAHICTCDSCRAFLESLANVSVQVMPLLAENRVRAADIVPPDGMRDRFLTSLACFLGLTRGEYLNLDLSHRFHKLCTTYRRYLMH